MARYDTIVGNNFVQTNFLKCGFSTMSGGIHFNMAKSNCNNNGNSS